MVQPSGSERVIRWRRWGDIFSWLLRTGNCTYCDRMECCTLEIPLSEFQLSHCEGICRLRRLKLRESLRSFKVRIDPRHTREGEEWHQ